LFTSVIDERRKRLLHSALGELIGAGFCAVFGMIYELFSHEVYSYYMIYAFMFPLAGGILLLIKALIGKKLPGRKFINCFNAASATLTLGSVSMGVVEIYGSTNKLLMIYQIAGGIMSLAAAFFYIKESKDLVSSEEPSVPVHAEG